MFIKYNLKYLFLPLKKYDIYDKNHWWFILSGSMIDDIIPNTLKKGSK